MLFLQKNMLRWKDSKILNIAFKYIYWHVLKFSGKLWIQTFEANIYTYVNYFFKDCIDFKQFKKLKELHNIFVINRRRLLFPYLCIGVINLYCIKQFRWQTFWLTSLSSRFSSLFDERYGFGICLQRIIIKGKWDKN